MPHPHSPRPQGKGPPKSRSPRVWGFPSSLPGMQGTPPPVCAQAESGRRFYPTAEARHGREQMKDFSENGSAHRQIAEARTGREQMKDFSKSGSMPRQRANEGFYAHLMSALADIERGTNNTCLCYHGNTCLCYDCTHLMSTISHIQCLSLHTSNVYHRGHLMSIFADIQCLPLRTSNVYYCEH